MAGSGEFPKSAGDIYYAEDANLSYGRLIGSDVTYQGESGAAYVTIGSVAVGAGEVNKYIIVIVSFMAEIELDVLAGAGNDEDAKCYAKVMVGEGGSETRKWPLAEPSSAGHSMLLHNISNTSATQPQFSYISKESTISFYYEPTSDEKTNGFNVLVQGKVVDTGAQAFGSIKHYSTYVYGV